MYSANGPNICLRRNLLTPYALCVVAHIDRSETQICILLVTEVNAVPIELLQLQRPVA